MDGVGQALTDCGMRGVFAWAGMDEFPKGHEPPAEFPGRKTTEETLAASERLVKRWHKTAGDRVRVSYGLRLEPNVSDELFQGVKACADRDQTLVQFHCLLPGLSEAVKERVGMSTVQWMAGLGALGPNWLLAHMVDASDSDVVIVKMHDARVAHDPKMARSKGKLAELLAARRDGRPRLRLDGRNDSLDMYGRCARWPPSSRKRGSGREALEMATIDRARALGWEAEIGSLEPGKRADVIVIDARRTDREPIHDFSTAAKLVYTAEGADVETTIVDGRVLMENRRLLTIEGDRVLAESRRIAERIVRQLPYQETLRPRWPVL